ncbi:MAG TPA: serine hydrolase [Pyrinomonadaceae bacterium]|nr:serine hydrolase [Pyrinomonadaceae bacterium]
MIKTFNILARSLFVLALLVNASVSLSQTLPRRNNQDTSSRDKKRLERFEKQVDDLRTLLKIPGMSAVIIKDQKVLWAKGFGFADLENRIAATPDTVFHLASLTKTFAAILIMQLVEQGKLNLDEPMSRYSSDFKNDSVKIKHLLSHTSEGTPGERYQYSGNQYDYLTAVIEKKLGKPFRVVIVETFLDPLAMSSSVPVHNIMDEADKWVASLGQENLNRYRTNLSRLSQPYTLHGDREIIHVPYPPKDFIGAAAGLLSTVLDMAKYDAAIDRHLFLKKETQEKAWTAFTSNSGQRLPYGLGWFVTDYHGLKLVWHYGHWGTGFSAIYLKVPEKNVSLVVLANSEALADHQFQVGEDITNNVFACNFLRLFVFEDAQGRSLPDPGWKQSAPEFSSEVTRLSRQSKGYAYDCERNSQTALAKWIEHRRKNARKSVRLDPKILEAYVGQYQYETVPERILTVSREGDRLFIDIPRNFRSELFAESESKFFLKTRPLQMTFVKDASQVAYMEVVGYGEPLRAKRIK